MLSQHKRNVSYQMLGGSDKNYCWSKVHIYLYYRNYTPYLGEVFLSSEQKDRVSLLWLTFRSRSASLLLESVVQEAGGQAHPQKFNLLKIREKSENLGKIPANLGKTAPQRCFTWKNGAQRLQKNKWRPFFWRSHHKNARKSCTTTFWAKSHCTPKNVLPPTPGRLPTSFLWCWALASKSGGIHLRLPCPCWALLPLPNNLHQHAWLLGRWRMHTFSRRWLAGQRLPWENVLLLVVSVFYFWMINTYSNVCLIYYYRTDHLLQMMFSCAFSPTTLINYKD